MSHRRGFFLLLQALQIQIGKLRRLRCSSLISTWVSSWTRCRRPWSCSCWLPSRGTFPRQLGKWAPILFLFYSCLLNRGRCQWKNGIKNQLSCSFCLSFECWKKTYSRCFHKSSSDSWIWFAFLPQVEWLRSLAVLVGLNLNCLSQTFFSPCSPLVRSWGKFKSFSPRRGLPLLLVALLLPTALIRAFLQCWEYDQAPIRSVPLPKSNVLPDSIPFFRNGGMAY